MNDSVGVAVVLCFCMLAVPIPMFSFSADPFIHWQASVRFSHFPWFSLFPYFPQRPIFQEVCVFFLGGEVGGGYLCHIVPRIAFSGFSNPLFSPTQPIIFLNCVVVCFFGGGLYETFASVPLSTFSIPTYFP